ncbi:MAG: cadherin domain-containing protein, partial [bacterium]
GVTTVTSSDVDGGAPTYSIIGGADQGVFSINGATGALTFNTAPNFEAPADAGADNVYDVTVQVSDGNGGTAMQAIAVTVTNVNEPPVVNDQAFSVAESSVNGTPVGTVIASDVDAGDTRTFSITAGNTGGAFTINTASGQITVANAAALDFETNPTFTLTIQVQDAGGLTDTASVSVTLADINEAPASDQPSDRPPQAPASPRVPDRRGGELSPEDQADSLIASSIAGAPTTIRQSIEGLARPAGRLTVPRDAIEHSFKHIAQRILSRIVPDQGRATATEPGTRASDKLWAAIDRMKAEMDTDQRRLIDALEVLTGAGVVFSVGVVAWLLRGGSLLASLLSTVPLWRGLDPLPILANRRTKEDEIRCRQPAQDDASIEGLFSSPPGGQPQ